MKIAVNRCHGVFDLSTAAKEKIAAKKGLKVYKYGIKQDDSKIFAVYDPVNEDEFLYICFTDKYLGEQTTETKVLEHFYNLDFLEDEKRTDTDLISVIEELGDLASGNYGMIDIFTIPDNTVWELNDYNGYETLTKFNNI
jgi:hypothetical protein